VGLLADGPVRWGQPVPARKPGIYVVELGASLPTAPLELSLVGKWLERLPGLALDGRRPTSRALQERLASLWWPDARVLYAGATDRSIGGRAAALVAYVPGDRQPHADGQWLHLLRGLDRIGVRLWWAVTDAPEEYLDAVFDAFAADRGAAPGRPPGALPLPWANTRRPTGERQAHGITGSIMPEPARTPEPPRRVVEIPPGDADGARPEERGAGTTRRAPQGPMPSQPPIRPIVPPKPIAARAPKRIPAAHVNKAPELVELSRGALDRMTAELDELTRVKRPEVVNRIKTAREHGDLKENAEYHAAREEQGFLENRIRTMEQTLKVATIVEPEARGAVVGVGTRLRVEHEGEELELMIVGSAEADPGSGKISNVSPVGRALLGRRVGDVVTVVTPGGDRRYELLAIE